MTLLLRTFLCALLLQVAAPLTRVDAQADRPRLMLNAGGPVGGIRALAFSADGSQLYGAGSGKVVNVWSIVGDQAPQAIPAESLRWEVARGMRGRIYTLDVAGPSGQLAIGGYSARDATGDLVVFNAAQQRIDTLLPRQRPNVHAPQSAPGHAQTVSSIDFSPSGRQLVSMSLDLEVRLWSIPAAESVVLQPAGKVTDGRIQTAAFVSDRRLLFPTQDANQPAAWRLARVNPANPTQPASVMAEPVFWYGVADIAVSTDGAEFAVSDYLGEVTLFANDNALASRPLGRPRQLSNGRMTRSVAAMAYSPDGRLAITTTADPNGVSWLELWEPAVDPPRMIVERALGPGRAAAAVAFNHDGRLLAVTRADRAAVELIPLREDRAPLDLERAVELTGRGREPGIVRFVGEQGYRVALESPSDAQALLFDLENLEVSSDASPPESRPEAATGWQLVAREPAPDAQQELQLFAPGRATPQCSIALETNPQGTYRLHTWLTDAQGAVYGVAVATDRQDGIFLYDLPASGRCRLMRYLRDHSDTIRSLSVCADGRYLVSSSADQTVKVWSLAGLRGVNADFGREDAWGATFAIDNGQVVVETAIGPGIAVHRDLLAGDLITRVVFAGPDGIETATDPRVILQALQDVPLWQTLQLTSARNGEPRAPILVTPAWEPVATLFVDRSYEWALWTPQGVYDASASGDELFGWHINVARDQDPQYFRAEKFRRELERPEVMRQLLNSGSLQDALVVVAAGQPPPRSIGDVAADIPQVRILSPQLGTSIDAGATIAVEAAVRYPDDPDLDATDYRVQLWINQRDGGEPQEVREVDGEYIYAWNVPPADHQNRLLVLVEEVSGAVDALFGDAAVQVSADVPQPDVALHVFALSAENYNGALRLPNSNNDALGVTELLQNHGGRQFQIGHVTIVNDADGHEAVQRGAVENAIAAMKQQLAQVSRDDILVVFVAGHGEAYVPDDNAGAASPSQYYFVPPHPELTPQLNDQQRKQLVRRIGIKWETLRTLATVDCRKLFLLDTCYSGNVALAEKGSMRLLKKSQAMVFAATSENQLALAANPIRKNHGLFTGFLLEACDGKADGVDAYSPVHPRFVALQDGKVNLKEVVSYVGHNSRRYFQHPKYTPIELLNFVDLSLFSVPNAAQNAAGAAGK